MNCQRCHTPNENDARFCKNCGLPFYSYQASSNPFAEKPAEDKSTNYLMILIALICAEIIIYKILQKIIAPLIYGHNDYGPGIQMVYKVLSWGFDLATISLSVFFLIKTKNKMVRIVLVVYAILMFINFFQYELMPFFEGNTNYYNL